MQKLKSINPSNYQVLGEVSISSPQEIEDKVKLARNAQKGWRDLGIAKRVRLLRKAIEEFKSRKSEFTLLESREMGMPINEAIADFDATLDYADW